MKKQVTVDFYTFEVAGKPRLVIRRSGPHAGRPVHTMIVDGKRRPAPAWVREAIADKRREDKVWVQELMLRKRRGEGIVKRNDR